MTADLSVVSTFEPPSQDDDGRTAEEWLAEGIERGFCGKWVCSHHEGTAMEDAKEFEALWEEYDGPDFCWPVVHLKAWQPDGLRG
jgi:hypothetical protein